MKRGYCGKLMALGVLVLAGCATPPPAVTPVDAVARLRTGQPLLGCREACLPAWQLAQPQAAQLDAGRRWADLAALIERIGYQDDLSLYYLGRAAEGLGYPAAAASYYRQSTYVSGTAIACQSLSRSCGGAVFPQAALLRISAIERSLARPRPPRRAVPGAREPESPAVTGAPAALPAVETGPVTPIEAATGALPALSEPPPPPPPPPVPTRPAPTDYIEPPPAIR